MMNYLALTLPGQEGEIKPPGNIPTGGIDKLGTVLMNGLTIFITVVVIITLFSMVYSGIQWITSGGDKNKIRAARARLTWSIVGLVLTFMTFFILNGLAYIFGVQGILTIQK